MYLPNPSTTSKMWHKAKFLADYVFTKPLHHKQDVTQGQVFSKLCILIRVI